MTKTYSTNFKYKNTTLEEVFLKKYFTDDNFAKLIVGTYLKIPQEMRFNTYAIKLDYDYKKIHLYYKANKENFEIFSKYYDNSFILEVGKQDDHYEIVLIA